MVAVGNDKRSAISTISPTPSGVSTNHVLDYFVPDIMKGANNGLISEDYERSSNPPFLEICSFLCDYRAAA